MPLPLASDFDERDLLFPGMRGIAVSRSLVAKLGLSTAMILGYFHEALQSPTHVMAQVPWVEVSCQDISVTLQRSFCSSTIRRHIKKLEELGLLKSCRFSTQNLRQTKSYTICYDEVERMIQN